MMHWQLVYRPRDPLLIPKGLSDCPRNATPALGFDLELLPPGPGQTVVFQLAEKARVSRSMLSAVERGEKAASVLILDQIATGLGTSIARLLASESEDRIIVLRADDQDRAVDPSGWERRILSPVLPNVEFEFMRTTLSPGVNAGAFLPTIPARGSMSRSSAVGSG